MQTIHIKMELILFNFMIFLQHSNTHIDIMLKVTSFVT